MRGANLRNRDFGSGMLSKFDELESKVWNRARRTAKDPPCRNGTLEQVLSVLAGESVFVRVLEQKEARGVINRMSTIGTASGRYSSRHAAGFLRTTFRGKLFSCSRRATSELGASFRPRTRNLSKDHRNRVRSNKHKPVSEIPNTSGKKGRL